MSLDFLSSLLNQWQITGLWLASFFIIFGILARYMPCNPTQPVIRPGMVTDILYSLLTPIFSRVVRIAFISLFVAIFFYDVPDDELDNYFRNGHGILATLPLWLQAAIVFILSDIILYWTHRMFHMSKLWPIHAIHHSPKHVDWLSTHRFHPLNVWFSFTLVDISMIMVGFSPESIGLMAVFNTLYSAMVHANVNWTFGPFKYVFASPVFHRWHHTTQKEGLDKNFAPTFPLLDIVFGTFYMPEDRLPKYYGVHGADIPESFIGQLIWPFRKATPK